MIKILSVSALILLCSSAYAQDGYYMKAGFGAGTSSSSFNVLPGVAPGNHGNVLSEQTQLNFGYAHGHLQLETGLGYLVTGLTYVPGGSGGGCVVGPGNNGSPVSAEYTTYTIKNPHLTVPLAVSYISSNKRKLSLSPGIGMEALYNFKGKMTSSVQSDNSSEKMDYSYNTISTAVLLKCDVQYKICSYMSVWLSPSYQNMVSSLTTKVQDDPMSRIYDRTFLINAGVKYNLHCAKHSTNAGREKI